MRIFAKLCFLLWPCFVHAKTEPVTIDQLDIRKVYSQTAPQQFETSVTRAALSLEDQHLLLAHSLLMATTHRRDIQLDMWFREDHLIYIYKELTPAERKELSEIFNKLEKVLRSGNRDVRSALNDLGHSLLIAKIARIDNEVLSLKDQHKHVIRLAIGTHEIENDQRYGEMPYSYHLREVRAVLKRFGFGPKTSVLGLKLGTAAWLHDIIEDTNVRYESVVDVVGVEIADIVRGVSKIEKSAGMTKEERVRATYERTAKIKASRILKVADRIANVEDGLIALFSGRPSIVLKYFEEWPLFVQMLHVPGECDEMWEHLQKLVTDLEYAQFQVINLLHKQRLWDCTALLSRSEKDDD